MSKGWERLDWLNIPGWVNKAAREKAPKSGGRRFTLYGRTFEYRVTPQRRKSTTKKPITKYIGQGNHKIVGCKTTTKLGGWEVDSVERRLRKASPRPRTETTRESKGLGTEPGG